MANLNELIGKVIAKEVSTITDDYPNSWGTLVPSGAELGLSDNAAWKGFLGRILLGVSNAIDPLALDNKADFSGLKDKSLFELRTAIKNAIICPNCIAAAKAAFGKAQGQ